MGIYYNVQEFGDKAFEYDGIISPKTGDLTDAEIETLTKFIGTKIHKISIGEPKFLNQPETYTKFEEYFIERIIQRVKYARTTGEDPFLIEDSQVASVKGLIHDFDLGLALENKQRFDLPTAVPLEDTEFTSALTLLGFPKEAILSYSAGGERKRLRDLAQERNLEEQIILL